MALAYQSFVLYMPFDYTVFYMIETGSIYVYRSKLLDGIEMDLEVDLEPPGVAPGATN